jgi:hypothetical protein
MVKGVAAGGKRERFAAPPWTKESEAWQAIDQHLPGDHLARRIDRAVDMLDLGPLFMPSKIIALDNVFITLPRLGPSRRPSGQNIDPGRPDRQPQGESAAERRPLSHGAERAAPP